MNLAELVLAILIQTSNVTNKLQLNNHNPSRFTPGLSLNERNLIRDRDLAEREAEQSRQSYSRYRATSARSGDRGTSYTGNGQAKIIEKDTQFFNCVSFAKAMSGVSTHLGNGARANIQGQEPKVGSVGAEKGVIHAVYVVAVNGDQVTFLESNYLKGYITERTISKNNFIGFTYE